MKTHCIQERHTLTIRQTRSEIRGLVIDAKTEGPIERGHPIVKRAIATAAYTVSILLILAELPGYMQR